MLLEFKARNYKSFKDELCLSMIPDPDETALDYSVMTEHVAGETLQALCSTVVYGPNASGKTNVISALDTFRRVVLRGNIDDDKEFKTYNTSAILLELIPNTTWKKQQPVEFSIRFFTGGVFIDYAFSMDLGNFMQEDYDRRILSESLSVNRIPIFTRTDAGGVKASASSLRKFSRFFKANVVSNLSAIRRLPGWEVEPCKLFLSQGFSSLLSPVLYKLIEEWVYKNLITFCRSDTLSMEAAFKKWMKEHPLSKDNITLLEGNVIPYDALAKIGACNPFVYLYDPEKNKFFISSVVRRNADNQSLVLPALAFESYGTYRFANLFPFLKDTFLNGSTLVLDEFDASLHPMVLMNIISLFHNPEINRNHAQLIFNTHNPIFLDRSLFRRDEIKFVERNEETQSSEIYALSDFEPERDCEDYLGNYFRDRYGAIQYVDLTPVFRKVMGLDGDEEAGEA